MRKILIVIIAMLGVEAGAETKDYDNPVRPPPLPAEWLMPGHVDKDRLHDWQRWLKKHPRSAYRLCVHMNEASGNAQQICQTRWK